MKKSFKEIYNMSAGEFEEYIESIPLTRLKEVRTSLKAQQVNMSYNSNLIAFRVGQIGDEINQDCEDARKVKNKGIKC